jgi:NADPH2:quinone reductase
LEKPNLESLAIRGRLVVIGLMGGASAKLDLARLLTRRLKIIGSVLRARPVEEKPTLARDLEARLFPLLRESRIKPVIHEVLPLNQAARAHTLVAANENFGKVILEVDPECQAE